MHGIGPQRPRTSRRVALLGGLALLIVLAVALIGIHGRRQHAADLTRETDQAAIPMVAVITPEHGTRPTDLVLPGDIEAWYAAPIYARVAGYLKMWYKDFGAPVKRGDLLAAIDTPELDQSFENAKAKLAEAMANEKLAEVTAQRWRHLLSSQSVSQQDTDVKVADEAAKKAQVQAAQADVDRLAALESFKRLTAPFDGVVTARETDIGDLINVGAGRQPELFKVADLHKMRVYVQVPQSVSAGILVGMKAELHLPQYPGRSFPAVVATTSNAINKAARTLLVELHAENPDGVLKPGTYADVHFALPPNPDTLRIPTSTLIFQEHGLQVAVVDKSDLVVMKHIRIGIDMGTEVQVIAGLSPADAVIDSPPDYLSPGDKVRVVGRHGAPPGRLGGPAAVSEAGE